MTTNPHNNNNEPKPRKKALLKLIILGDSGVGKTSLLRQFLHRRFSTDYQATVGADFYTKEVIIEDHRVTLQIWDTAGMEKFHSLGVAFYRGADCCVLAFDLADVASFKSLEGWREEFFAQASPQNRSSFPFFVFGNKSDLDSSRCVTRKRAQRWCAHHGDVPYFEVSAKDTASVEAAFLAVARDSFSRESDNDGLDFNQPICLDEKKKRYSCGC